MTTPQTEWPNPPVPESVKALLKKFYELGDSKAEDSGRRMAQEVFTPTGQITVNKRKINGSEGMICIYLSTSIGHVPSPLNPEQAGSRDVPNTMISRN